MCERCVDADKKLEMIKAHPGCTGIIESPFLTVDQLKHQLSHEWEETGRNDFRIISAAIINPPQDGLKWVANHKGMKSHISVRFV